MAYFEEMMVQGIRSYPPATQSVIKFVHPITIIQGNNGCGKTTLIESLSHICTGALPAGQKQAFLHSLERAKVKKVDALIKLRFKDKLNREVVACTRMTNVAGKEGKATTRADEATIKIPDKNLSISSKTVDFKVEMLNLLGIPKAILDNVIFCHQENSTWPLSEPKVLKSKFDDIFQLTMYVKFIDKVKTKMKDYREKCNVAHAEYEGASVIQIEKQESQSRLEQKQIELKEATQRQAELYTEMEQITKQQRAASDQLQKLRELQQKKNVTVAKLEGIQKQRGMLNVPDWSGTEEELRGLIKEMESSSEFRSASEQKAKLEGRIREMDRECEQVKLERRQLEQEMTKSAAAQMHRDSIAADLRDTTASVADEYGLRADVKMREQLEMLLEEMKRQGEARVRDLSAKEREVRQQLDAASNVCLSAELQLNALKELHVKLQREAAEVENRLGAISSSQNEVPELRGQIAELERQLAAQPPAPTRGQSAQLEQRKKSLVDEINRLREAIKTAVRWEEIGRERERLTNERATERAAYDKLISKHEADMMTLFNRIVRDEPMSAKISMMFEKLTQKQNQERDVVKNAEIALDRALNLVRAKTDERDTLMDEQRELKEKIAETTGDSELEPEDVEWRHEQSMSSVQSSRKELAPLEASATLYDKWSSETRARGCCPMCERDFASARDVRALADKLADMSMRIPDESAALAARLEEQEAEERKFQQAKSYVEQLGTVTGKWRSAKKELELAEKEAAVCREELSKTRAGLAKVTVAAEAVNSLKADVSLMDSHLASIARATAQLEDGERDWEKEGFAAVNRKETEENELKRSESELESINSRLDSFQRVAAEVNRITKEMNTLRDHILRLDEDMVQQSSIEERLQKLKEEMRDTERRIEKIKEGEPTRHRELEEVRERQTAAESETRAAENDVAATLSKLSARRDRIVQLTTELDRLQKDAGNIDSCRSAIGICDNRLDQLRARKAECEHEMGRVGETQSKRRVLTDQLMLIENKRSMANLERELEQFGDCDREIATVERRHDQAEQSLKTLIRQQGDNDGVIRSVTDEVDRLQIRLKSAGMKEADAKFVKAATRRMIMDKALADLTLYSKTIEENMIEFHKEKMEMINIIVDELWRQCYQGIDIETIRIMSEQSTESDNKRKVYNYRVMMQYVGGQEVDMRDRCSAGQKMLACLIIRLALADVFGSQCATIALDEPTTNLDIDKIEAMADMIGTLINTRSSKNHMEQGGKGIQMIVITHDKKFVERLTLLTRPEYHYEISKDESNAMSIITRVYTNGNREVCAATQVLVEDEQDGAKKTTRGRKRKDVTTID